MRELWLLTFLWRILMGGCQSLLLVRRAWHRVHLAVLDHLDNRFIFRLLSVSDERQVFDRGRDTLRLNEIIDHCIDRNDVLAVRAGGLVRLQGSSIQDVFYHSTCWFWLLSVCSPAIKSRCPLTWLKCLRSLSRLLVTLVVIENSIFIRLTLQYLLIWVDYSPRAYWAGVCHPNIAPLGACVWIFVINRRLLELFQVFLFVILLSAWNFKCWQISCYTRVGSIVYSLCPRPLHFCKSLIDTFLVLEIQYFFGIWCRWALRLNCRILSTALERWALHVVATVILFWTNRVPMSSSWVCLKALNVSNGWGLCCGAEHAFLYRHKRLLVVLLSLNFHVSIGN